MGRTTEFKSWRDELRELCPTQMQKEAIASSGSFSVRTLNRWISGIGNPQKQENIKFLASLSQEMWILLQDEFPEAFSTEKQAFPLQRAILPAEFFRRVLHSYSHTAPIARRWTIFHLVTSQMIPHIDTERTGLMIIYVRYQNNTLLLDEGSGNNDWITRQYLYNGCSEPWLVQAVKASKPFFVQSVSDSGLRVPDCFCQNHLVESIGFFPLYRAGFVGGGILLFSTKGDFFTPERQNLIEDYCGLLALAFEDSDFIINT